MLQTANGVADILELLHHKEEARLFRALEKYIPDFEKQVEALGQLIALRDALGGWNKLEEFMEAHAREHFVATLAPALERILKEKLDRRVDELKMSPRLFTCLRQDDIRYIGQLVQKSEADLLKLRNFGRRTLDQLKGLLGNLDLSLHMKLPGWTPPSDNPGGMGGT